jgi:formylglycine-generating enzyme required for sulfatase activity
VWTKLLRLPAGEFRLGSDPLRDPLALKHELPQHRVTLSAYFIGQYPITNAQYHAFVKATRHQSDAGAWPAPLGKDNHPAVNVTWDDVVAFCKWLSNVTGREFRLPTEAEWERAARGDDGRVYAWGDEWDAARANGGGAHGDTTPVGQFSPLGDSPYALADVAGNVWEWCLDWFSHQTYGRRSRPVTPNPSGANSGEGCVLRGGAFDSSPKQLRCAHRNWQYPYKAQKNVGFRIVAAP